MADVGDAAMPSAFARGRGRGRGRNQQLKASKEPPAPGRVPENPSMSPRPILGRPGAASGAVEPSGVQTESFANRALDHIENESGQTINPESNEKVRKLLEMKVGLGKGSNKTSNVDRASQNPSRPDFERPSIICAAGDGRQRRFIDKRKPSDSPAEEHATNFDEEYKIQASIISTSAEHQHPPDLIGDGATVFDFSKLNLTIKTGGDGDREVIISGEDHVSGEAVPLPPSPTNSSSSFSSNTSFNSIPLAKQFVATSSSSIGSNMSERHPLPGRIPASGSSSSTAVGPTSLDFPAPGHSVNASLPVDHAVQMNTMKYHPGQQLVPGMAPAAPPMNSLPPNIDPQVAQQHVQHMQLIMAQQIFAAQSMNPVLAQSTSPAQYLPKFSSPQANFSPTRPDVNANRDANAGTNSMLPNTNSIPLNTNTMSSYFSNSQSTNSKHPVVNYMDSSSHSKLVSVELIDETNDSIPSMFPAAFGNAPAVDNEYEIGQWPPADKTNALTPQSSACTSSCGPPAQSSGSDLNVDAQEFVPGLILSTQPVMNTNVDTVVSEYGERWSDNGANTQVGISNINGQMTSFDGSQQLNFNSNGQVTIFGGNALVANFDANSPMMGNYNPNTGVVNYGVDSQIPNVTSLPASPAMTGSLLMTEAANSERSFTDSSFNSSSATDSSSATTILTVGSGSGIRLHDLPPYITEVTNNPAINLLKCSLASLYTRPGNFEDHLYDLNSSLAYYVTDKETLTLMVDIIFELVVDRRPFAYTAAKLCKYLCDLEPEKDPENLVFRTEMLKRCQHLFKERTTMNPTRLKGYAIFLAELYQVCTLSDGSKIKALKKSLVNITLELIQPHDPEMFKVAIKVLKCMGPDLDESDRENKVDTMGPVYQEVAASLAACADSTVCDMGQKLLEFRESDWGRMEETDQPDLPAPDPRDGFYQPEPVFFNSQGHCISRAEAGFPEEFVFDPQSWSTNDTDRLNTNGLNRGSRPSTPMSDDEDPDDLLDAYEEFVNELPIKNSS